MEYKNGYNSNAPDTYTVNECILGKARNHIIFEYIKSDTIEQVKARRVKNFAKSGK